MSLASTTRPVYRQYIKVPSQPCSDCEMPQEPCSAAHCGPSAVLTSQCTDQCVVIACDDPDHAPSVCDEQGAHNHCDLVCDDTIDCTDCHGFDAFLQCCDGYPAFHPVPQQAQRPPQQHPPHQHFPWDTPLPDFWCNDCGPKPTTNFDSPLDPNLQQYGSTLRVSQLGPVDKTMQPAYPPTQQEAFHMDPYARASTSRSAFSCMWDSCQESFSSLSELIGHVNLNHLVGSSSSRINDGANSAAPIPRHQQFSQPCHWADCTSPQVPTFHHPDELAYHLLHDHLGVSTPPLPFEQPVLPAAIPSITSLPPVPVIPTPPSYESPNPPQIQHSSSGSSTPTIVDDEQHSCHGTHDCRWKDCGLSFPSCDDLTTHITVAHIGGGKAHYECFWDQCTRSGPNGFQSKQKISRHVQSHTGHRPFQCTICQQYFSEAATLQQHIRRHTQEKPYVCDHPGCGKSFAITGALTIHKRTHNGDKPFKCTYCDRGFAESSNLSKHLRTHTGARPYVCSVCHKAFARPDQLNRHKSVHKKQD